MSNKLRNIQKKQLNNRASAPTVQLTRADLDDLPLVSCPNCQSTLFSKAFQMRRLSALHPKNTLGRDDKLIVPVTYCISCETVLERS